MKTWHLKCFGFEICSTPWNLPLKLELRRRIVHVARYYFWIEREQENILLSKRYLKYYFVPHLIPTWIEIEFRRGFCHGRRKNSGVSVAGGGVTVALKSENLRGISEQHRFTFELYDKKKKKNSKLTFKVKETIRCRFGMMGKHRVTKEQSWKKGNSSRQKH